MADQKAFSEPMRSIVSDYIEQTQTFEDLNQENSLSQRLISATKNDQPKLYSMQIVKRYWETVETKKDGESRLEIRCYSLAEVPTTEFSEAKAAYIAKMNKNPEVKKLMAEIGKTGTRNKADIARTDHADVHGRVPQMSSTKSLSRYP